MFAHKNCMDFLEKTLATYGYQQIRFKVTRTNHLLILGKINGVNGRFIVDTGASTTCVGLDKATHFFLKSRKSSTLAAGAGATGMQTRISKQNIVRLGQWQINNCKIVLFDLSHVNTALAAHRVSAVDGIIGADILLEGHGIIDYYNQQLYLQNAVKT